MCQGGKDFQRFLGNTLLLVAAHVAQGTHVVQAVGELDDDDAHVLGHGQEHLAHAVELLVFFGTVIEAAQLGDAVDEEGYFLAEHLLDIFQGVRRIFDDIVEERRRNGRRIYFHICQYLGDGQGMQDIRFPADAALVLVGLFGQVIGFGHVIAFGLGQIRMYRVDEVFEFDIFIFKFHNMKPPHSLQYNSYVGDA